MSIREGYKQTEIGVIPEEWEVLKFEQFFETVGSKKYQIQKQDYVQNGLIPVVDQGQKFIVSFSNDHEKILKNENGLIVFGDHTRIIKFINFDFIVGADGTQILKAKKTVDIKFAYYLLCAKEIVSLGYSRHFKLVKEFLYQCPPLSEQQKIAEILSTVDQKIDSIDSKIEETQTLKRGLMQRLLSEGIGHSEFKESEVGRIPTGWEALQLGNLCQFSQGIQIPYSEQIQEYQEGYIRYLYIRDFFSDKDKCYVKDIYPNKIMKKEDIMIVNTGNTAGKVYSGAEGVLSNNAFKLSFNTNVLDRDYLFQFLKSHLFENFIKRLFNSAGQPHVGHKNIALVPFCLPPLEEQKQIAEILSTTDEKLETLRAKKEAFETLKRGLMQKLLSGEVRVGI